MKKEKTDRIRITTMAKLSELKDDLKHHCKICEMFYGKEKKYVKQATLFDHIFKEHLDNPMFLNEFDKVEKEMEEKEKEWLKERILNTFSDNEKSWLEAKKEFLRRLNEDFSLSTALSWTAESIVEAEAKYRVMKDVEVFFNKLKVRDDWSELKLKEFYNGLSDEKRRIKDTLINHHYTHNSTSLMSNAVSLWTAQGKANCVRDYSWDGLNSLEKYVSDLIDLIEGKEEEDEERT